MTGNWVNVALKRVGADAVQTFRDNAQVELRAITSSRIAPPCCKDLPRQPRSMEIYTRAASDAQRSQIAYHYCTGRVKNILMGLDALGANMTSALARRQNQKRRKFSILTSNFL